MRPNHLNYKHKINERKERENIRKERAEKLAELEEQFAKALANSQNTDLVAQYNHFLAIKKEYETYNFEDGFNAEQAVKEISAVISEFRIQYVGVDKRDLDSIKTQLNIYRSLNNSKPQEVEPEM